MAGTARFDTAASDGTINFGIGQPSADLLPLDLLQKASEFFFASARPVDLNYGDIRGDRRWLYSLATFLTAQYGAQTNPDSLFLSAGNSQALDFVTGVLSAPGDTIFVEEPSYFLAFQIFRDHGLNIVGIPVDEHGLNPEGLRSALEIHRPRLLYTVPSFHNPSGRSLTASRRRELVELSQQHDFVIIADEVYQMLYFDQPPPPALGTMTGSGSVVSLGSFSKILAPALRLGWMQSSPGVQEKLTAAGMPNSGGSMNHFVSHIARAFIDLGLQSQHLDSVREKLRHRCDAMDDALQRHFGGLAHWTKPEGGYFFWLECDESVDSASLKRKAASEKVGFQAGRVFSSTSGLNHCLRLAFSHYTEPDIDRGIARLRRLFDTLPRG